MSGLQTPILNRFLSGNEGVPRSALFRKNSHEFDVSGGEEPLGLPYLPHRFTILSSNVPNCPQATVIVAFRMWFLSADYRINFPIDLTDGMEMGYNVVRWVRKVEIMKKNGGNPNNMARLVERWVNDCRPAKNLEKKARHAVRVICRGLGYAELIECPLEGFPVTRSELKDIPRTEKPLQNDDGFRSLISAAMNVVRFGLEKGWLVAPPSAGQALGFPHYYIERRTGSEWNRTQWVWNRLVAFAAGHNRRCDKLDHPFFLSFFQTIIRERGEDLGRRDLRWFIQTVRADAEAGLLPDVDLPDLPNKKAQEYALPLGHWPAKFQPGIEKIQDWLRADMVENRDAKQKVREVSARRDLKHLELLGGFVATIRGEDLRRHDWQSILDSENVFEFLVWTDDDAEHDEEEGQILTGIYQEGLLNTFIKFAEGPLRLPGEAKRLSDLRFRFLFERKRSGPPKELTPDTFFRCAAKLIDQAKLADSRGQQLTAATYRRDALLVALMGLYPRRADTAHRITVDAHLILREGDLPKVAIPREDTKPEKRDSILEIPEELVPLFNSYLNKDRPLLLGSNDQKETAFFVSQGGKPFCPGNARSIVRRRMSEEIGFNIGPHSARHVWAPRFLLWSHGDYLSAMAVLDTSLEHIEKAYRDAQETERAAGYFNNTERRWKEVEDERRNGNGTQGTQPSI